MKIIKNFFEQKLPHWDLILFSVILFYFTIRLYFFAASITPDIPPDEANRVQLIVTYSQYQGLILPESLQAPHLDFVTGMPYLYFWIMGKLLLLNIFSISPLMFLRIIHVLISIITVTISFKLFRLLSSDKLTSLLGAVVLTNIPMYSFLAAFVSYDNVANLCAVSSFYLIFSFFKTRKQNFLWAAVTVALLGSLIKHSLLPIPLTLCLLYAIDLLKTRKKNLTTSGTKKFKITPKKTFVSLTIALLLFLNAHLYLTNLIRYRHIVPRCEQILPLSQCLEKKNVKAVLDLEAYAKTVPRENFLKVHDYFFYWRMAIERTIFGIFGHKVMFRSSTGLLPYNILLILFLILFIRYFHPRETLIAYCALSSTIYLWILFYHLNYKTHYLNLFFIEAGLQGRYVFPVIYLIVFLFSYFLLNFVHRKLKILLFLTVCFIFILGDLPYFLSHADKSWYIKNPKDITIETTQRI